MHTNRHLIAIPLCLLLVLGPAALTGCGGGSDNSGSAASAAPVGSANIATGTNPTHQPVWDSTEYFFGQWIVTWTDSKNNNVEFVLTFASDGDNYSDVENGSCVFLPPSMPNFQKLGNFTGQRNGASFSLTGTVPYTVTTPVLRGNGGPAIVTIAGNFINAAPVLHRAEGQVVIHYSNGTSEGPYSCSMGGPQ